MGSLVELCGPCRVLGVATFDPILLPLYPPTAQVAEANSVDVNVVTLSAVQPGGLELM